MDVRAVAIVTQELIKHNDLFDFTIEKLSQDWFEQQIRVLHPSIKFHLYHTYKWSLDEDNSIFFEKIVLKHGINDVMAFLYSIKLTLREGQEEILT